jgi:hypothetical protein
MPKYDALWAAWAPLTQTKKERIKALDHVEAKADGLDGKLSDLKMNDK